MRVPLSYAIPMIEVCAINWSDRGQGVSLR